MEATLKQKPVVKSLEDVILDITWAKIAKRYFPDKSITWFYNKMRGVDGNGGNGEFTEEEKEQLKGALMDFSQRVRKAAEDIEI